MNGLSVAFVAYGLTAIIAMITAAGMAVATRIIELVNRRKGKSPERAQ